MLLLLFFFFCMYKAIRYTFLLIVVVVVVQISLPCKSIFGKMSCLLFGEIVTKRYVRIFEIIILSGHKKKLGSYTYYRTKFNTE
jgi:hypothetical protein